jgi:hypothetical protein
MLYLIIIIYDIKGISFIILWVSQKSEYPYLDRLFIKDGNRQCHKKGLQLLKKLMISQKLLDIVY